MWIVQMADLHNSNKYSINIIDKIIGEVGESVNEYVGNDELLVFCICGDIINKGDKIGFNETKVFLQKIESKLNTKNVKFVICPGNHDIVDLDKHKSFKELDRLIYDIDHDTESLFEGSSVNLKVIDNIDFIIVNSVYHYNHKFGKVDLPKLNEVIQASKNTKKVVVVHHHLIPIKEGDQSTIVNSYEFLRQLDSKGVLAILHGHQHMKMHLVMGEDFCRIIGVGSILSEIETNYSNQFNLIQVDNCKINRIIEFKFSMEEIGSGTFGRFLPVEMNIKRDDYESD